MRELELYLHIPFCVKKCRYCDFLSAPGRLCDIEAYTEALVKEIPIYKQEFADCQVRSIFFGGGTPSILSAEQMQRLMKVIFNTFSIAEDAEISMEVNPGTVTAEKLRGYLAAGINRLSIGLQSVHDEELRFLGRIHDYQTFLETYHLARECGFGNINIDLISAIPGQTVKSWSDSLRQVAELNPEHISAYSLIIEEGTPFYEMYGEQKDETTANQPALPDEEAERQMYQDTQRILQEYGYHRYEISNYAKEGFECRHNLGYWERREYLGIGTGAASLIGNRRFNRIKDTQEYILRADTPKDLFCDMETLSLEEQMEEFMFLGLRKTQGVRKCDFQKSFGKTVESVYDEVIGKLEADDLLLNEPDRICLTERGVDISNYVLAQFLLDA